MIIFPHFRLMYLLSLENLGSSLEFKIKFCVSEQCLAAQHELVMTDPGGGYCFLVILFFNFLLKEYYKFYFFSIVD